MPTPFLGQLSTVRQIVDVVNGILRGKVNSKAAVTLTAGATSTVVTDPLCAPDTAVLLQPTTANAAGALATTYIVAAKGSFTITHANAVSTDRTFNYVLLGG